MTTLATLDLEAIVGGAFSSWHPPVQDEPQETKSWYRRDKGGDWTSCAGGFWTGCPPKKTD